MNILIVPDKFKGTLTAAEAAKAIATGLADSYPDADLCISPMADGGEGSLDVMEYLSGEKSDRVKVETFDALAHPMEAEMLWFEETKRIFIEMASCCGLSLISPEERNPLKTSSFGLGVMIAQAISRFHPQEILIAMGGSATNDGGMGMLSALGYRFFSAENKELFPKNGPQSMGYLARITPPAGIKFPDFTILYDVMNPMLGATGATMVYGGQKCAESASPEEKAEILSVLETIMGNYKKVLSSLSHKLFWAKTDGIGAAGATSAPLIALAKTTMVSGAAYFVQMGSLKEKIEVSDFVVTGEGRFDEQTASGKLIAEIIRLCKAARKKLYILCGQNTVPDARWKRLGIERVFPITDVAGIEEHALRFPSHYLIQATQTLFAKPEETKNVDASDFANVVASYFETHDELFSNRDVTNPEGEPKK